MSLTELVNQNTLIKAHAIRFTQLGQSASIIDLKSDYIGVLDGAVVTFIAHAFQFNYPKQGAFRATNLSGAIDNTNLSLLSSINNFDFTLPINFIALTYGIDAYRTQQEPIYRSSYMSVTEISINNKQLSFSCSMPNLEHKMFPTKTYNSTQYGGLGQWN